MTSPGAPGELTLCHATFRWLIEGGIQRLALPVLALVHEVTSTVAAMKGGGAECKGPPDPELVAVWVSVSLLVQVAVVFVLTFRPAGANAKFRVVTAVPVTGAFAAGELACMLMQGIAGTLEALPEPAEKEGGDPPRALSSLPRRARSGEDQAARLSGMPTA
ncbi:hypothetical protein ACFYZJ_39105 [Streptomyces sp. NPDC001848]|uniref:hypothetical protein n=1 Tax=Streptomyces sp. NPDC001848 TaxID=3364618 RepID=UPI0036AD8BBE